MTKIALICSVYDDYAGMMRLLQTIPQDLFDRIVVVEGRYKGYPHHEVTDIGGYYVPYRTKFGERFVFERIDGMTQVEKRNRCMKLANDMDYALLVDSDEYLQISDIQAFKNGLEINKDSPLRCFPITASNLMQRMTMPRLFHRIDGLHYKQNPETVSHSQIWDESGNEVVRGIWDYYKANNKTYFPGIKIIHDKNLRSEFRVASDLTYQTLIVNR